MTLPRHRPSQKKTRRLCWPAGWCLWLDACLCLHHRCPRRPRVCVVNDDDNKDTDTNNAENRRRVGAGGAEHLNESNGTRREQQAQSVSYRFARFICHLAISHFVNERGASPRPEIEMSPSSFPRWQRNTRMFHRNRSPSCRHNRTSPHRCVQMPRRYRRQSRVLPSDRHAWPPHTCWFTRR